MQVARCGGVVRLAAAVIALAATAVVTAGVLGAGMRAAPPVLPPTAGGALIHDAYVWQRAWTPAVSRSVAAAPADLAALRVLMAEVPAATGATTDDAVWPAVDVEALARAKRPVIAVVRVDGRRVPEALEIGAVVERVGRWRAAGADVRGIEIDHDCATAGLDDYAAWLERNRPPSPLGWSITALPTWAGAAALPRVAAAVDELVVQVHAVQAPKVFDSDAGWLGLMAFAASVPGARLRVALPTYRVRLMGRMVSANWYELAWFVMMLEEEPIPGVVGVVWFRLPVEGDDTALPASTLVTLIRRERPPSRVTVELEYRKPGVFDVVLVNHGTEPAPWPTVLLDGDIDAVDLIRAYRAAPDGRWLPPPRDVPGGRRVIVGWVTGKDLRAAER
jgi:hypothetical protein